ncbi:formate dehydrogenase subunit alpha [Candidatus Hydrogenedentota bacterium]
MVKLTINGQEIVGKDGSTVLETATSYGIAIPNLCHDPRLTPVGACRMCVVEIEGDRGLQTACTRKIAPGMVVKTDTDEIRETRKTILELLFSEHSGNCATCDKYGDCQLQFFAYQYQVSDDLFGSVAPSAEENYTIGNEAIEYDVGKCIRCGRCVRICEEVQMDEALTFQGRAANIQVSTAFNIPLNDSTCELCGCCVSTCPTGALYERHARAEGQIKDLSRTRTTCVYCGVGCQILLNVNPLTNKIVRAVSNPLTKPNYGNLCVKGRFGFDFVSDESRLTTPLIKRDGKFEEATWEEAIKLVADKLKETKAAHGADSIGGLSSAKCTNEDNYVFQKFIRAVLGTNNVDHCARLCHASTVAGLAQAFGSGAMTNSIDELRHAKCIFVIGSNTTEAHPVIGLAIKEAVVKNGATVVVADPRAIDLTRFSKIHMRQRPGSDVALINAMMNVIIEEGLHDEDFIKKRTENYESMAETVSKYSPESVSETTGVPADLIREAARAYASAETGSIVYSMGITQHSTGTDNVLSLANLAMLTGNIGREGTGVNPLRGQNNVQGACDLGALPNVYPGYQSVEDPELQKKFEKAWGAELSPKKGLTVVEMMHAIEEDQLKALFVMGENPALSDPNLNRTRKALEDVEFLVVQDIFLTETAQYADVVLPSLCFAEREGTFTNTERRVQMVRTAVRGPGQAGNDWETICKIASAIGYEMDYADASKIMDEIASVSPIYAGIAHNRLENLGLQWPCLDKEHPGTKFLHEGTFKRGNGKFHAVEFIEPAELPDDEYPLVLSTGRQLYQFHTGTMSRKSRAIHQVSPTGYVEINPTDAEARGVVDGAQVQVATRRGEVTTVARVTDAITKGYIFMPFHFNEAAANMLTNDVLDSTAKIPEFKVCAARLKKAD